MTDLENDKQKVREFFEQFKKLKLEELSTMPGKDVHTRITEALDIFKKGIIQESQKLL